eukprot:SAG22_NODE_2706_length_2296_cov_2.034137_1_plen_106_part_00
MIDDLVLPGGGLAAVRVKPESCWVVSYAPGPGGRMFVPSSNFRGSGSGQGRQTDRQTGSKERHGLRQHNSSGSTAERQCLTQYSPGRATSRKPFGLDSVARYSGS